MRLHAIFVVGTSCYCTQTCLCCAQSCRAVMTLSRSGMMPSYLRYKPRPNRGPKTPITSSEGLSPRDLPNLSSEPQSVGVRCA